MSTRYHAMIAPGGLTQQILSEYDPEAIASAYEQGFKFVAVDENGVGTEVSPDEVVQPWEDIEFTTVAPVYVDKRMEAVVDVFDALVLSLPSTATTLSTNTTDYSAFYEALANLRAIVNKEADDADS